MMSESNESNGNRNSFVPLVHIYRFISRGEFLTVAVAGAAQPARPFSLFGFRGQTPCAFGLRTCVLLVAAVAVCFERMERLSQ